MDINCSCCKHYATTLLSWSYQLYEVINVLCINFRPYWNANNTYILWIQRKNWNKQAREEPDLAWFNVHVLQDLFQQDWSMWFLVSRQRQMLRASALAVWCEWRTGAETLSLIWLPPGIAICTFVHSPLSTASQAQGRQEDMTEGRHLETGKKLKIQSLDLSSA